MYSCHEVIIKIESNNGILPIKHRYETLYITGIQELKIKNNTVTFLCRHNPKQVLDMRGIKCRISSDYPRTWLNNFTIELNCNYEIETIDPFWYKNNIGV